MVMEEEDPPGRDEELQLRSSSLALDLQRQCLHASGSTIPDSSHRLVRSRYVGLHCYTSQTHQALVLFAISLIVVGLML
jgi:hypothetical protein